METIDTRDFPGEIDVFESHYQYDATYLRELFRYSPEVYEKFDTFMSLAQHNEQLDPEVYWLAKITSMHVEDCGQCLQLCVFMATEHGISKELINSALSGGSDLPDSLKDIFMYTRCVAGNTDIPEDLEERIHGKLDSPSLIELALCIACAKVFPALKRTLGYAKSCHLIEIQV